MVVINLISSLKLGGAEECVVNFTTAALSLGVDARIILLSSEGLERRSEKIKSVCQVFEGARVHQVPMLLSKYLIPIRNEPITLIVSFWPLAVASVFEKLRRGPRLKLIFWEHHFTSKYSLFTRLLLLVSFNWVDYIIGWRRSWAPLKGMLGQRCQFVDTGNPIRLARESKMGTFPFSRQIGPYRIVVCSRLVEAKCVTESIYSFLLSDVFKCSTLTIFGSGPLYDDLRALIDGLQLNNVYLVGPIQNPVDHFGLYDLCVIQSPAEGFCNVVVESLSCRTPVLIGDNGSVASDLIKDYDCGLILSDATVDGFAQAIGEIVLRRRRASSCSEALRKYEPKKWASALLQL